MLVVGLVHFARVISDDVCAILIGSQHLWFKATCSVLDMSCSCGLCDQCIEQRLDEAREQERESKEIEEAEEELENEFPDFQDATCKAILEHVCEHDSEGICCLRKRRRIMQEAESLAEAWESAENLKKLFRKNKIPNTVWHVCQFLK